MYLSATKYAIIFPQAENLKLQDTMADIEQQVTTVSKSTGPVGPQGPRGHAGPQGVDGIKGISICFL